LSTPARSLVTSAAMTLYNYSGNRRIPVVFATGGAARLVVRRETRADPHARDVE
jgi:hypothetical protein